jgi:hypothetical protein
MAKKKKKKKGFIEPKGLKVIYEAGDEVEVRARIVDGGKIVNSRTLVRITHVGPACMGLRIIGQSQEKKFVVGHEVSIEGDHFVVITANKMNGVVQYIPE